MIKIERIQARMEALALNPYATAKKAGLGPDYVRDLLRGKVKQPSAAKLRDLAIALECSTDFLMGEVEAPGETPFTWTSNAPVAAKLSVEHRIREGFHEKKSIFTPDNHESYWVVSAIKEGDEWLERVESLSEPKPLLPRQTLIHVVDPKHFYPGLTDLFVVEIERDDGRLHGRALRRTKAKRVDDYRFLGAYTEEPKSWKEMVEGAFPAYGKIVGAVVRSYQFYDDGVAIDEMF